MITEHLKPCNVFPYLWRGQWTARHLVDDSVNFSLAWACSPAHCIFSPPSMLNQETHGKLPNNS